MNDTFPAAGDLRHLVGDLRRKSARLSTLNDFALQLMRIPTGDKLVWYVARSVVGRLGFDDCVVYLIDPEREMLRQVAAIGNKNPRDDEIANALEIAVGNGITGAVAQSMQAIVVDDVRKDSRYISDVGEACSEICVPLVVDGRAVGVIDCEGSRPGQFGSDDLELLTTVAAMTSAKLQLIEQARRDEERAAEIQRAADTMKREISQRRKLEEQLLKVQRLYAHTESLAGLGHWEYDEIEERFLAASAEMARLHGYSVEDFLGKMRSLAADIERVHPLDREYFAASVQEFKRNPKRTVLEYKLLCHTGDTLDVREIWEPVLDAVGTLVRSVGVMQDISERKFAERKLRESEARLKAAAKIAKLGYFAWDLIEDKCTFYSQECARIHGVTVADYMAEPPSTADDMKWLHPDDRERYQAAAEASLRLQEPLDIEYRIIRKDDEIRHLHENEVLYFDAAGRAFRSEGVVQDITDIKLAEERLHQAQKMEAVGQLTGGVAHDFNNLLAVIQGHAELMAERGAGGLDPATLVKFTGVIMRATKRGAELTQRLLAFSRQQPLCPEAIDLADLVSDLSEFVGCSLGETISLETQAPADLWPAMADPGQVEVALLNLALNARDAMPAGGILRIECDNAVLDEQDVARIPDARVGDYVMLAVTDTGQGMSQAVLERVFEPFFTTKEIGEGSGLGLSMVYGFTKQSGGHVAVCTEVGVGTTVRLYLPRSAVAAEKGRGVDAKILPRGKGETILLIEDDPDVRTLTIKLLESLEYRTVAVADSDNASDVLAAGLVADLVLSDVVLPGGTSGPEFIENARLHYPNLKVVFMSGYTSEAAGGIGRDTPLIDKPFQRRELAHVLRETLDRGAASATGASSRP